MPPALIGFLVTAASVVQTVQQVLQVIQTFTNLVSPAVNTYQDSAKTEADDNTYLDALNDTVLPKVKEEVERNGGTFDMPDRIDSAVELNDLNEVLEKMVARAGELGLSNDEVSQLKKTIDTNKEIAGNLIRRGKYDDTQQKGGMLSDSGNSAVKIASLPNSLRA
jgi:hypothetical protein